MAVVTDRLAGQEVTADDPAGPTVVVGDHVEHVHAVVERDRAEMDLAGERLVRAEQQLLAGLTAGIERTRDLSATEAAVVEQAAVFAGERHALRHALVDDVHRHFGQAPHVGLAGTEVATLDRVVEEPVDAVAVTLVVLGAVDAPLRGDRVGPSGGGVVGEDLHVVALLAERSGGRSPGQAGPNHDDVELAPIVGSDELEVELVVRPLVGEGTGRDV